MRTSGTDHLSRLAGLPVRDRLLVPGGQIVEVVTQLSERYPLTDMTKRRRMWEVSDCLKDWQVRLVGDIYVDHNGSGVIDALVVDALVPFGLNAEVECKRGDDQHDHAQRDRKREGHRKLSQHLRARSSRAHA